MKLISTLLLSILGTVGVTGTEVAFSAGAGRVPKEPPSTTLVVHIETPLSVATQIQPNTVSAQSLSVPRKNALTLPYQFNEQSKRVKVLQRALKTVSIDGVYGPITRREHLKALTAAGLPTDLVPPVKVPEPRYNISYDKTDRCPMYEDEIRAAGLEPVDVFSYIAYRESRCRVGAINAIWKNGKIVWTLNKDGSYDSGLLQINSSWKTVVSKVCKAEYGNLKVLLDLDCNLLVAKYIMDNSQGKLGNWRVYRQN